MQSTRDVAVAMIEAGEIDWNIITADLDPGWYPEVFFTWHFKTEHRFDIYMDDYIEALTQAWVTTDSPESEVIREAWIEAFELAEFTVNGEPADRPTSPVYLYRGGITWNGMSWTSIRSVAERFARESGGEVWECEVHPEDILAVIEDRQGGEGEHVVNPVNLGGIFGTCPLQELLEAMEGFVMKS